MTFGSTFGRVLSPTFQPSSQAVVVGGWSGTDTWWLSGSISSSNCLIAYEAKNAPSYALSLTNLANPGTYNATEGVAPAWDTTTGWTGNGSTKYLKTGLVPQSSWSAFIRFDNCTVSVLECPFGSRQTGTNDNGMLLFLISTATYSPRYGNIISDARTTTGNHVFGFAGTNRYWDGDRNTDVNGNTTTTEELYIVACNNRGAMGYPITGNVIAFSVYNTVLSDAQAGALTTAMAAL